MLRKQHGELAVAVFDVDTRARKGVLNRGIERRPIADLANGLQRGRQIAAIVREHRRARADLRVARGRVGIGAKVIVEAPGPHLLAERQQFRCAIRVGHHREHALECGEPRDRIVPFTVGAAQTHRRSTTIG